jgi:hypothetical protein
MGGLLDQPGHALLRMERIKMADGVIDEVEEKKSAAKAEAEERVEKRYGAKG